MESLIHKSHMKNRKILYLILRPKQLELEAMKLRFNFFAANLNTLNKFRK
jgi:hypothetical protein